MNHFNDDKFNVGDKVITKKTWEPSFKHFFSADVYSFFVDNVHNVEGTDHINFFQTIKLENYDGWLLSTAFELYNEPIANFSLECE